MKKFLLALSLCSISFACFAQNAETTYTLSATSTSIFFKSSSGQVNEYPVNSIYLQYSKDSTKVKLINIYDDDNVVMSTPDIVTHFYGMANKASMDSFYSCCMISATGGGGGGGVSSVGLSLPSNIFNVSGSPVTGSGTLTGSYKTGLAANQFLATPEGGVGTMVLRLIGINDLSSITVTTLRVSNNTTLPTVKAIDDTLTYYQVGDTSATWWQTAAEINVVLSQYAKLISPSFTTPSLGVATATSINKIVFPAPATSATVTVADGKNVTFSNSLTFLGTDGVSVTFPTTNCSVARRDGANTFTGIQTLSVAPVFSWATNVNGLIYVGSGGNVLQTTSTTPTQVQLLTHQLLDVQFGTFSPITTWNTMWSARPTVNDSSYYTNGDLVTVTYDLTGTSNTANLTLTVNLPFTSYNFATGVDTWINAAGVADNGGFAAGVIRIPSNSNIGFFYKNATRTSSFSATGVKAIQCSITYRRNSFDIYSIFMLLIFFINFKIKNYGKL